MYIETFLFTNISLNDTRVFDISNREFKFFHRSTYSLFHITKIRINREDHYRFRIKIIENKKNIIEFIEIFKDYVQFINESISTFIKRINMSHDFLLSSDNIFLDPFKRKRRSSIALVKSIIVVTRLKMITALEIVKRKSQMGGVHITDRRVSVSSAFEDKVFRSFLLAFSWGRG